MSCTLMDLKLRNKIIKIAKPIAASAAATVKVKIRKSDLPHYAKRRESYKIKVNRQALVQLTSKPQ